MPSAKFSINGDAHGGLAAITKLKKGCMSCPMTEQRDQEYHH